jgi:addiction module HigA family antidote
MIIAIVYCVTLHNSNWYDHYMTTDQETRVHPGLHIKNNILPPGLSVKDAAKLLGVGRPALSNLLNGKAALSPEMALRLAKTFGANQEELLQLQAKFDQQDMRERAPDIKVRAYVPSFLTIKAKDIEYWADGNLEARSLLAILLRKLVHSTGQKLLHVDFPGYDNAERKGWDGQIKADAATPWIPHGKSGWEFGCNENPRQKAEGDYTNRVAAIPAKERAELHFVFVTPRSWPGKQKWAKEKEALREWKSVTVYDASDLEQWLEQSIPAQGWFAKQLNIPDEGVHTLEEYWHGWASVTEPELSKEIFALSIERHKEKLTSWIENPPALPLVLSGDSKAEALAFLSCLFNADDLAAGGYTDKAIVFSSAEALKKLAASSSEFIPVIFTDEVEREAGGIYKKMHTIIIRPRNTAGSEPDIALDLLNYQAFEKALTAMGIEYDRIDTLARESGYSPTILRRRLSKYPAIRTPLWARDAATVRNLIPMMLVGAWHARSNADCEILSFLSAAAYDEIEKHIAATLKFEDCPIWSVGQFRGVVSKIDALFAVHDAVTQKDIEDFFLAAEIVLSETDPALDLPEDDRWAAGLYGKTRDHSAALRQGICETLVLLAVHGNNLFAERLGINLEAKVNALIRRLLTPMTPEKLFSQSDNLPMYAEAAPNEFLTIIDEDLKTPEPQFYALMKPAGSGIFAGCPRTGLLWALEGLAWKPDQLLRVCVILARLSQRKIDDNWVNKPDNSLLAIFRSWMPQTAASLDQRIAALEKLTRQFPQVGWQICLQQFNAGSQIGHNSHRPRWRSDASGAGRHIPQERYLFVRKALDLAIGWPNHTGDTLGDLIEALQYLSEADQIKIWDLVDQWIETEDNDLARAKLREHIRRFSLTRRGKRRRLNNQTRDRALKAYTHLMPRDPVIRHQWLFAKTWVDESAEEIDDEKFDYQKREERIRKLRVDALTEIWAAQKFDGIKSLLIISGAPSVVGWHLADGVIGPEGSITFVQQCINVEDQTNLLKIDDMLSGFLGKLEGKIRTEIVASFSAGLPRPKLLRLIKCLPFERQTWRQLESLGPEVDRPYWKDVYPGWIGREESEINYVIDKLLEAKRPRAAFQSAHYSFKEVETSRLKRLLHEVATSDSEPTGMFQLNTYDISKALDVLQDRPGMTEEEMAALEFKYIRALDHTEHGIPNLQRQFAKSPSLFMQIIALTYKRSDDGEDPPEWGIKDLKKNHPLFSAAYAALHKMKYIPGRDQGGSIDIEKLRSWLTELRSLCQKHARAKIGDHIIGEILATAPEGQDGIWPCMPVRLVLEEIASQDIASGMRIGVYNRRGIHSRDEGGNQERELAEKYRNWSRQLAFEYPYVANIVAQIATSYDYDAAREDSEAAVRKRLHY